jgi:tetratricopeptide (TPR) repeat protein
MSRGWQFIPTADLASLHCGPFSAIYSTQANELIPAERQAMARRNERRRRQPRSISSTQSREIPGPSQAAAAGAPAPRSFEPGHWLYFAALVTVVLLVYLPAWHGGFIWDDDAHVTRPELRSWHGLFRIWFDLGATQQYYPLLHSAFWLQHRLWGDAVLGYHLVNILLHAAAAIMAALILRRLAIPGAFLAAAVFALHPVQVESVAWITELKNTLSAVFYLGSMMAYLQFDRMRQNVEGKRDSLFPVGCSTLDVRRSFPVYAMALGLFVLGLLSKTVTATLPGALLVIFWWQRGRLSWKKDALPLVPFFMLGAAAGVFTAWVERTMIGAEGAAYAIPFLERGLIAGRVIWFYLGKLFWPAELIFIYPRWQVSQAAAWQYLFPAAALALGAALWALRRRSRAPLAALLYFVGTLFPVLGFFNVFPFIYSFVADHFQYLASLGIITLASAGLATLLQRRGLWRRPAGYAICGVLLATLAGLTWRQSRMYADIETLYQNTLDANPTCWMAHNNLGQALVSLGRSEEAIDHFRKALEIKPDHAEAHNNLGAALFKKGQVDEAIGHYQAALGSKPRSVETHSNIGLALLAKGQVDDATAHYSKAVEIRPDFEHAHYSLGTALARQGRTDEAIFHYRKALEIKPDDVDALVRLGEALASRGEIDGAIASYQRAIGIKPDHVDAHISLGNAAMARGQVDAAIVHYRQALDIMPDNADAHYNLGVAAAEQGQGDAAIAHFQKALHFKPDHAESHNNLGVVLARRGQGDQAIAHFEQALQFRPDYAEAHNNIGIALARRGQIDEAIAHFEQALRIKPDYAEARRRLDAARGRRQ